MIIKNYKTVKIFQIRNIADTMYAFRDFDENRFNFNDYNCMFNGEVECEEACCGDLATLESIWEVFNIDHPLNFHGHSLSVSDIVFVNNKYYYCQSMGWEDITKYCKVNMI